MVDGKATPHQPRAFSKVSRSGDRKSRRWEALRGETEHYGWSFVVSRFVED
jgi:hypothetical protein